MLQAIILFPSSLLPFEHYSVKPEIVQQKEKPAYHDPYLHHLLFCVQTVDWWSLGVLAYELMTGASPFTSENAEENTQSEVSRRILKVDPKIPEYLSPEMRDLIRRLMIKDPVKRLGARGVQEIKKHKFFRVSRTFVLRKEIIGLDVLVF